METKSEYMMTEIGEIPANWEVCALGTYIKVQGGYAFKSNQFSDNGIRILRISNIKESGLSLNECKYYSDNDAKGLDNYYLNENDTVIAMSGATTGKSSLVKKDDLPLLVNQRVGTYKRKNERNTDQKFIYYTVSSNYYQQKLWEHAIGGAQPNISSTQLESIIVAYPPLNEQQKIAEILSTVDEQIEQTDQLIGKTKELKKGLMQQLLTKGIGHTEFKQTELGEIPDEWSLLRLQEVLKVMYGKSQTKVEVEESDIPILGTGGIIGWSKEPLYSKKSVLIGRKGTIDKPVYIDKPFWTIDTLFYTDIETTKADVKFIYYLFQSIDWYRYNEATGVPSLSSKNILNILFACPSLKEQKRIASILSAVDEDIEGYEKERAKYEELKKGLMQQLLTGKKRVKV